MPTLRLLMLYRLFILCILIITVLDPKTHNQIYAQTADHSHKSAHSPTELLTVDTPDSTAEEIPSVNLYKRKDVIRLPGMENINDLFQLESGAAIVGEEPDLFYRQSSTRDQLRTRDQSLSSVHFRGSRPNQIQYLIEGSPVQHPLYGGRNLLNLNLSSVQSVKFYKGVAPVRYGQAQSGIVNMEMRKPGNEFTLETGYKMGSDQFGHNSFDRNRLTFFAGDLAPFTNKFQVALSGGFDLSDTPYHMAKSSKPDYSVLSIPLTAHQENRSNLNATANYQLTSDQRLRLNYNGYWSQWHEFSWVWNFYPDQLADFDRRTHHLNLSYQHKWENRSRLEFSFSYLDNHYEADAGKRNIGDYWINVGTDSMRSIVEPIQFNPRDRRTDLFSGFVDSGSIQDIWQREETAVNTFQGHYKSPWFGVHRFTIGAGTQSMELDYGQIMHGATSLSPYGQQELRGVDFTRVISPPPGPYSFFGSYRSFFQTNPGKMFGYLQYQLQLEDLKVRAGLRLDRFDRGSSINDQEYREALKNATSSSLFDYVEHGEPKFHQTTRALSPRVTIQYPYDQSSFYFSYGHFNQMPELQYLYRDPFSGGLVGNPSLDYITTEQFEFGMNHRILPHLRLNLTGYHKEVEGLPNAITVLGSHIPTTTFRDEGKSRIWGAEIGTNWNPTPHFKLSGQYAVQWAEGNRLYNPGFNLFETQNNNPFTFRNDIPRTVSGHPLNWNRRHQVVLQSRLQSPSGDPLQLFGLGLPSGWNLSLLWKYDSGVPYTPYTTEISETIQQWNSSTTDYRMRTDLKFTKRFHWDGVGTTLFVETINLFNQTNVNPDFGFNHDTGQPYKVGDRDPETGQFLNFQDVFQHLDPRRHLPGFQLQIGAKLSL